MFSRDDRAWRRRCGIATARTGHHADRSQKWLFNTNAVSPLVLTVGRVRRLRQPRAVTSSFNEKRIGGSKCCLSRPTSRYWGRFRGQRVQKDGGPSGGPYSGPLRWPQGAARVQQNRISIAEGGARNSPMPGSHAKGERPRSGEGPARPAPAPDRSRSPFACLNTGLADSVELLLRVGSIFSR